MKVLSDKIIDDVLKQAFWDDNHPPEGAVPSKVRVKAEEAHYGQWYFVALFQKWGKKLPGHGHDGAIHFIKPALGVIALHAGDIVYPIAEAEDKPDERCKYCGLEEQPDGTIVNTAGPEICGSCSIKPDWCIIGDLEVGEEFEIKGIIEVKYERYVATHFESGEPGLVMLHPHTPCTRMKKKESSQ